MAGGGNKSTIPQSQAIPAELVTNTDDCHTRDEKDGPARADEESLAICHDMTRAHSKLQDQVNGGLMVWLAQIQIVAGAQEPKQSAGMMRLVSSDGISKRFIHVVQLCKPDG
eukprot:205186-Prymnesium_polylepis.1